MASKIYKVDQDKFINIKDPENAYLLGLIWADGTIQQYKDIKRKTISNIISITTTEEDFIDYQSIFNKTGEWKHYFYIPKNKNAKKVCFIKTSNKILTNYLLQQDYKAKSYKSADKILNTIPINLRKYFFRGLFDGDGCLYIAKKRTDYKVFIASSYEQDWTFVETLFKQLNIKYNIVRQINKKYIKKNGEYGKHSKIIITNINDCLKFLDYIYENRIEDNLGLNRKYNLYLILKNKLNMNPGISYRKIIKNYEKPWRATTKQSNLNKSKELGRFKTEEEARECLRQYYLKNPFIINDNTRPFYIPEYMMVVYKKESV